MKKEGLTIPVYSDSKVAISWIKAKKCKTELEQTDSNSDLFELIQRAETWLANNEVVNPVYGWDTKAWGDIPADFGRK